MAERLAMQISSLAFDELSTRLASSGEEARLRFDVQRRTFIDMGEIALYPDGPKSAARSGTRLFGAVADGLIEIASGRKSGPIRVDALVVTVLGINLAPLTARLGIEWTFNGKTVVEVCEVDVAIGANATVIGLAQTLTFNLRP